MSLPVFLRSESGGQGLLGVAVGDRGTLHAQDVGDGDLVHAAQVGEDHDVELVGGQPTGPGQAGFQGVPCWSRRGLPAARTTVSRSSSDRNHSLGFSDGYGVISRPLLMAC